jgi:predicted AAA+ superfamily ATPase
MRFEIKKVYSSSAENTLKSYLREYLKYGGFPNIVIEKEIAERFFKEYLDLVVFRDVIERHKIKNVFIIKFLIKNMISSFAKEFSIHNLFNTLKSQNIKVSKKTLYEYALYLEDAFFSFFFNKK